MFFRVGDFLDLLGWLGCEFDKFGFVKSIQVPIILRNQNIDFAIGFDVSRREFLSLVIPLGSPSDVVGVAKGVDIEDIDISRGEHDILEKTGDHMPWVEEEDASNDPEDISGKQRNDHTEELRILEDG